MNKVIHRVRRSTWGIDIGKQFKRKEEKIIESRRDFTSNLTYKTAYFKTFTPQSRSELNIPASSIPQ